MATITTKGEVMDGAPLRAEIVESQKFIVDLEKWKLILVAALGAAGLGVIPGSQSRVPVLLGLIPIVCVYVDVLVYHNGLRMRLISRFLQGGSHEDRFSREYEAFCEKNRRVFPLEEYVLFATTLLLSIAVAAFPRHLDMDTSVRRILTIAGLMGVVAATAARMIREWYIDYLAGSHLTWARAKRMGRPIVTALTFMVAAGVLSWLIGR